MSSTSGAVVSNGGTAGVWIAAAAILVQAPRLVLALLAADRQAVGAGTERMLLVVAGVGTALVLTGGNLYLAHTIARVERWRGALVAAWVVVLVSTGGLVVPLVTAGLGGRTLPQVLGSEAAAWSWSVLAALAHEVTAAGCVLAAAAAAAGDREAETSHRREVAELMAQRDAARCELAMRAEQAERDRSGTAALGATLSCPEGCGRSFPSRAALAGHLRHCAGRAARLRRLAAAPFAASEAAAGGTGARGRRAGTS